MKKNSLLIGYAALLLLVFAFILGTRGYAGESVGNYMDDSVITTKVKALLAEDELLKSFQVGVKTYKGTVQLSGFVNSQDAVAKAGKIAKSVKGVKTVKNSLIVK